MRKIGGETETLTTDSKLIFRLYFKKTSSERRQNIIFESVVNVFVNPYFHLLYLILSDLPNRPFLSLSLSLYIYIYIYICIYMYVCIYM